MLEKYPSLVTWVNRALDVLAVFLLAWLVSEFIR